MNNALLNDILDEIRERFLEIDETQLSELLDAVRVSKRVTLHGKGRMGMVLKAFGCELLSAGKDVRVVADVTSPHIGEGDLFIGASASGFPLASTRFFELPRQNGGKTAAITAYRKGPVGELADLFIEIKARTMNLDVVDVPSLQPMCSTLEQVELLSMDYIARLYREKAEVTRSGIEEYIDLVLSPMRKFDAGRADAFIDAIEAGKKLYFTAEKREQHILSTFAMRVHHMGFKAYVTHEVNCPEEEAGDVLVAAIMNDSDLVGKLRCRIAAEKGMKIVVIAPKRELTDLPEHKTLLLDLADDDDAVLYTERMMIFLDYVVRRMMERHSWQESDLSCRHTNME